MEKSSEELFYVTLQICLFDQGNRILRSNNLSVTLCTTSLGIQLSLVRVSVSSSFSSSAVSKKMLTASTTRTSSPEYRTPFIQAD